MFEITEFLSLLVLNYLLLGSLIAVLANMLTSALNFNATTRHNIWFGVLMLLLALPVLSFLSLPSLRDPSTLEAEYNTPSVVIDVDITEPVLIDDSLQRSDGIGDQGFTHRSIQEPIQGFTQEPTQEPTQGHADLPHGEIQGQPTWVNAASGIIRNIELHAQFLRWAGLVFAFMLIVGMVSRTKSIVQLHNRLRFLAASSNPVEGRLYTEFSSLANSMGLAKVPQLKSSDRISTPLASGLFSPLVLIPNNMIRPGVSEKMLHQVLTHELAHIHRRDTFVVLVQVISSIFLFWHPAFHYINRKIRFEREIACDDWVLQFNGHESNLVAHSYANNLVEISRSLLDEYPPLHTLACVQPANGLRNRVTILLDAELDHSTSTDLRPIGLTTLMTIGIAFLWAPVWPQHPFGLIDAEALEVAAVQVQHPELNQVPVVENTGLDRSAVLPEAAQSVVDLQVPIKELQNQVSSNDPVSTITAVSPQSSPNDSQNLALYSTIEPSPLVLSVPEALTGNITSEPATTDIGSVWGDSVDGSDENDSDDQGSGENAVSRSLRLSINDSGELHIGAPTTIEEITVTAKRSLYALRSQIRRAERNLFSTYNEHNLQKEFEVNCRRAELYEDVRRSFRCWPKFFEDAVADDAQMVVLTGLQGSSVLSNLSRGTYIASSMTTPISTLRARNRRNFELFRDNIVAVAMEHPEVYESLADVAYLKAAYDIKHEECMSKPAVLFVFRRCT